MGPSLRSSQELITSSILCMPREPSSIGTSERVWKKVSSPRPEKILPPSRRIMKKSELRPPKEKVRKKVWNELIECVSSQKSVHKTVMFLSISLDNFIFKLEHLT